MKLIGVIFRGSLLGAHRRGHPILPGLPDASPHHRQPAVCGTTTSRGRVRDGGLDLHHHLHLHHPPLHHPPPPPPPVVSGAAKLVKRAVITSDTQELSHADANCGQECFFLWSHPLPIQQKKQLWKGTIKMARILLKKCFSPLITTIYRESCASMSNKSIKRQKVKVKHAQTPQMHWSAVAVRAPKIRALKIRVPEVRAPLSRCSGSGFSHPGSLSRCSRSGHWPWQAAKGRRRRPRYPFLLSLGQLPEL